MEAVCEKNGRRYRGSYFLRSLWAKSNIEGEEAEEKDYEAEALFGLRTSSAVDVVV